MPEGSAASPTLARVSGKKYVFPSNDQKLEAVALEADGADGVRVSVRVNGADQQLVCHHRRWTKGRLHLGSAPGLSGKADQAVAASGAWAGEDTYVAKLCLYETPFSLTIKLQFAGDRLFHDAEMNASFGPTRQARLEGKIP